MMNFNEIFKKIVTSDNLKPDNLLITKNQGFSLSRDDYFGKTIRGPPSPFRVKA